MKSERIVMGEAPDKEPKLKIKLWIPSVLIVLLFVIVAVILVNPFRQKETKAPELTITETEKKGETGIAVEEVSKKTEVVVPIPLKPESTTKAESPKVASVTPKSVNSHKVVEGECLWIIAGYPEIYKDPYRWTEIFNANKDRIDNPDLIYPGQDLKVPR